jgi:hypothetical protein
MFSYFSPESRVPATHPLRSIKRDADAVLASLSGELDELYSTPRRVAHRSRRNGCSRRAF